MLVYQIMAWHLENSLRLITSRGSNSNGSSNSSSTA